MSYKASTQDHVYTNHVSDEEGGNDEFVYSNSEDITKYRIPVTELQNVINEKYRDDGFLMEYKVSLVYMEPTILWMLLLTFCIRSYINYLMVMISKNAAEYINYINVRTNKSLLIMWKK